MADPFDTLMEVQEHDTSLDQLRHRIDSLPERLELQEVEKRQHSLESETVEVRTRVDDLAGRQRLLEDRIAAAAKRRHEIEQRMESGEVSASRDLQAMDHEVHHLSARQAQFEEEEPLDSLLMEREAAASSLAADAGRLSAAIDEAEGEIRLSIAEEERLRAENAARLPVDLAARYEKLRARLGGVGAARLVGDRCDGCHLTLPSVEFERIRHLAPGEFATCPQCDRILVH